MKTTKYLIITLAAILFMSCEKQNLFTKNTDDVFYLRNNDADMPVTVKGNTASRTFIIWLHGGPGSSCLPQIYGDYSIMEMLEDDYANVYWDQRCAGNSTGKFDPDNLSVDVMVDDLEKLVVLLKNRYGNDISIVLLGHSWGGTFGYSYLVKGSNQENIDGYICVSGGHNTPLLLQQQKTETLELANRQIELGNCVSEWEDVITRMNGYDELDTDNWIPMNTLAHKTAEYLVKVDSINEAHWSWFDPKIIFGTPAYETSLMNKFIITPKSSIIDELKELDITDQLVKITLPVLIASGKYDMVVTKSQTSIAYDLIGSANKKHVVFERSGHASYISEPEKFKNEVDQFINNL